LINCFYPAGGAFAPPPNINYLFANFSIDF